MVFGLKRIFKKKSKKEPQTTPTPTTPAAVETKKTVPVTPPTQPVKEDPPGENERRDDDYLPVKKNLLNIPDYDLGTTHSGENDYVFEDSEYPDDEPPPPPSITMERTSSGSQNGSSFSQTPPRGGKSNTLTNATTTTTTTTMMTSAMEPEIDEEQALQEQPEFSPLRPRKLEAPDFLVKEADDEDMNDNNNNNESQDSPSVEGGESAEEAGELKYDAAKSLMNIFERAKQFAMDPCGGGIALPEPIQRLVPTVDNAMLCQPAPVTRNRSDPSTTATRPTVVREYSYYDEQFALKFLDVSRRKQ